MPGWPPNHKAVRQLSRVHFLKSPHSSPTTTTSYPRYVDTQSTFVHLTRQSCIRPVMTDRRPQVADPQYHHCGKITTSSSVAMQPTTEPQARHKMPLLPAEIILAICRCFTVHPHNPAKGFHVSLSARDNIRALRQLSLTCRAVHDIVTPALYSSIYFTGPRTDPDLPVPTDRQNPGAESLVYFLRTILQNLKLRQYVRDVACLIDLRDACDFEEEMNTPNKDYGILSAIRNCKDTEAKSLLGMAESWIELSSDFGFDVAFGTNSRRPIISMSHQAFALIICLLPNLGSISMTTGSRGPRYAHACNYYDWNAIGTMGRSDSNTAQHGLLQNLRTLQVQCEPQSHVPIHEDVVISLHMLIPILHNASNSSKVTHFRSFGCINLWEDLPKTLTSFECWGPLPFPTSIWGPMLHLKSVVIQLVSSSRVFDFDVDMFIFYDTLELPALEHLEVLLSPGTRINLTSKYPHPVALRRLSRLQSFFFDTSFISDEEWEDSIPRDFGSVLSALPPNIETLRLIDSEPRHNFGSITMQVIKRIHLRQQDLSRLKRVEYLHMPPLADAHRNASGWSSSKLADEVKQELALDGVHFQLYLMNDDGGDFSRAEFPGQEGTQTQAHFITDA